MCNFRFGEGERKSVARHPRNPLFLCLARQARLVSWTKTPPAIQNQFMSIQITKKRLGVGTASSPWRVCRRSKWGRGRPYSVFCHVPRQNSGNLCFCLISASFLRHFLRIFICHACRLSVPVEGFRRLLSAEIDPQRLLSGRSVLFAGDISPSDFPLIRGLT